MEEDVDGSFYLFKIHFWSTYMAAFLFFIPLFFSQTVKNRVLKPSGIVSLFSLANKIGLNMSDVTSGHHQKWWVKKYKLQSFYSKPIWIYIVFSALMKSAHCTRHWRVSFRVFVFKNNFQILAFQCFKSSFPVRIRVRRDPPHPLVCRQRQLNGAVLRMRPEKLRSRVATSARLIYGVSS